MPGQAINHIVAIRLRALGTGNLKSKLLGLPGFTGTQEEQSLVDTLLTGTNTFPTVLANFNQMGAQLELKTTEIDEVFIINKIYFYNKVIASGFPQ